MPLKLVPPGKRKGNKFYLILGMEAGVQYEVSSRTTDKRLAKQRLDQLKEKIAGAPAAGQRITFAQAAELYRAFRKPRAVELKRIDKVVGELGRRRLARLRHADLLAATDRAFAGRGPGPMHRPVRHPLS